MINPPVKDPSQAETIAEIAAAVAEIRFGSVEIVIHDGRIVQLIRTEKVRVEQKAPK